MILRATKIVAFPTRAEELRRLYGEVTQSFTRRCAGNLAVRLYRHVDTPNTFFIHSWWQRIEEIRLAMAQPEYAYMVERVHDLAIERMLTWELAIDHDLTSGMRIEPAGTEVMRMARVVSRPGASGELGRLYDEHTRQFTLRQAGCLGVRLMRLMATPNTYFVQSYWRRRADLHKALDKDAYGQIRAASLRVIIERIQTWNLALLEDDPEEPLFALPGTRGRAGEPAAAS